MFKKATRLHFVLLINLFLFPSRTCREVADPTADTVNDSLEEMCSQLLNGTTQKHNPSAKENVTIVNVYNMAERHPGCKYKSIAALPGMTAAEVRACRVNQGSRDCSKTHAWYYCVEVGKHSSQLATMSNNTHDHSVALVHTKSCSSP